MLTIILQIGLWLSLLGTPSEYAFEKETTLQKSFTLEDCTIEIYSQRNGPSTSQRMVAVFPTLTKTTPAGAVIVPYYFPEAMLGCEIADLGDIRALCDIPGLEGYKGVEMMLHLAKRGFVALSAEAYHLTYTDLPLARDDFSRWAQTSQVFNASYPDWCGIGKLVADTELLVDFAASDSRIDNSRIAIAGHSLGGKIAFCTGCLDPRIRCIVASDFGYLWESTNWEAAWYWGEDLAAAKGSEKGHNLLLDYAAKTHKDLDFCWIAGHDDGPASLTEMKKSGAWKKHFRKVPGSFLFINHASGHRPTPEALEAAYDFLEASLR